ncbi:MAG: hypothetical protein ACRC2T_02930 [Thermoguttaceae bacterium]
MNYLDNHAVIIAAVPLALYLTWVIGLRLRRKPTVISGPTDFLLLGFAVVGLMFVGPIKLLFPIGALMIWKSATYGMLISLYFLFVVLFGGIIGPRIVIYNIDGSKFTTVVDKLLANSGVESTGNCINIPNIGVQFSYDVQKWGRCVVLRPTRRNQNIAGWVQLQKVICEYV